MPRSSLPSSGLTRTVAGPRKGDSSSSRKQILRVATGPADFESSNAGPAVVWAESLPARTKSPAARTSGKAVRDKPMAGLHTRLADESLPQLNCDELAVSSQLSVSSP